MSYKISKYRICFLKFIYLATFLTFGYEAWYTFLTKKVLWNPLSGVAYSFWLVYTTLMLFGLRYPLKLLPLILLQFFYKLIWIFTVAIPIWKSGKLDLITAGLSKSFLIIIFIDLLAIPWSYVFKNFFWKPGN